MAKKPTTTKAKPKAKPGNRGAPLGPAARALVAQAGATDAPDGEKRATGLPGPNGQWPADKVERWPLETLVPYARNARTHSPEQVSELARSIETFGWTMPILVDEDGVIIAGHGRVLAAHQLALPEAPVMVARGWTDAQKRAYGLADNKLALNAGWDPALLREELLFLGGQGVDPALLGFNDVELVTFLATPPDPNKDPNAVPPAGPPVTRRGDLWVCGRHRILCGDATNAEDVKLALDGAKPQLTVTDPPYGVEYDPKWRNESLKDAWTAPRATGAVHADDRCDWSAAFLLCPGAVIYAWHPAGAMQADHFNALVKAGFEIRMTIIWAKQHFVIGRGNYHVQHEPCFYAVRKGHKANWSGDRTQSTLWQIANASAMGGKKDDQVSGHGTQKPIECMARPIRNNSVPGDAIYEPFSGSFTTGIACEMLNRSCRALEIVPAYCDLGVRRWQDYTGQAATMGGKTYAAIAAERGVTALAGASHEPTKAPDKPKARAGAQAG